jgi:hypothetical protein
VHRYEDSLPAFLARLRPGPLFISLTCPDCPHVVVGKGDVHARELLAIHQEGTCQGGKGVDRDGASDPSPDRAGREDVLQVIPRRRMYYK